jgi:hypothetical protein
MFRDGLADESKRFTPGFEPILTKRSLLVAYLILAVSLVLGGVQRIA